MVKKLSAMLFIAIVCTWTACSKRPKDPRIVIRVTGIEFNCDSDLLTGNSEYEIEFVFEVCNLGRTSVTFNQMNVVWFFGKDPVGAAMYGLSKGGDMTYTYLLANDCDEICFGPDDVPAILAMGMSSLDEERVIVILPGKARSFQLQTMGGMGCPGDVERKVLVCLVGDDRTFGPYAIFAPSKL